MNKDIQQQPTIAAIATAKGVGGVGVVRVSGANTKEIAVHILGRLPRPRLATYTDFVGNNNEIIDSGLAIFFQAPNSYTGEDVLELQAHGGPAILDCLLEQVLKLGCNIASPGEFSKRAFLNNKIDLAQAEAVLDLINASSKQAALAATNTLKGAFSKKINQLNQDIVSLRMFVEAAIDFPEEEIDFLQDKKIATELEKIKQTINETLAKAKTGSKLSEGINAVILGKPNAGKSSLLNALAENDIAIVTDIPGTTRDTLNNSINIAGVTLNLTDTAGLRETTNPIEKEGIRRALEKAGGAQIIFFVLDGEIEKDLNPLSICGDLKNNICEDHILIIIVNKIDKVKLQPKVEKDKDNNYKLYLSAKTGAGLHLVQEIIQEIAGISSSTEGVFSARRRHIIALESARDSILAGEEVLRSAAAGDLLAEELRVANGFLAKITGEFSSDDLLGRIFSEFCIGK